MNSELILLFDSYLIVPQFSLANGKCSRLLQDPEVEGPEVTADCSLLIEPSQKRGAEISTCLSLEMGFAY